MKVDILHNDGKVVLTNSAGESFNVSVMEFWEIVRSGIRLDTVDELENYLADADEFAGVDVDVIKANSALKDEIVDRVVDVRVQNETGDQIYDAICYCLKYGKNKDAVASHIPDKAIEAMEYADFQDVDRQRKFYSLLGHVSNLRHELDGMAGYDYPEETFQAVENALGDALFQMDILRVKEWLSKQPFDLDVGSSQYQEAMDMLEDICIYFFPELAEMVFDNSDGNLFFREPHDSGLYVWAYYNPDANAGGQIVECSFGAADAARLARTTAPEEVVDAKHTYLSDVNRKEFFMTIFDMLKMKEDGWFIGTDIQEVCREIVYGKSEVIQQLQERIIESFQEGRSTYELSGWENGNVTVCCDSDFFTDRKFHFVADESQFFYDMEQLGQAPAHEFIAGKLVGYIQTGELQLCEPCPVQKGSLEKTLDDAVERSICAEQGSAGVIVKDDTSKDLGI